MDAEKNDAMEQALTMLLESVQQGKDFVLEQAPLVAQEVVAYGRATNTIHASLLIVAAFALWYAIRGARDAFDIGSENEMPGTFKMLGGGFVALLCGIIGSAHIDAAMKCWFAPRLYLIEYISSVLK